MTFLARFTGRCGLCQEPIHVGDEVEHLDSELVHSACADDFPDDDDRDV